MHSLYVFLLPYGVYSGFLLLLDVLRDILSHGITAIKPSLFLNDPAPPREEGGGLRNAFVGHLLITIFATLIGVPVGILGGTFLAK